MSDELVGAALRARRESLGISLEQMSKTTNIRPALLQAFEESDYEKHPPKGYASGMLSSYARALGMDPRQILSGYGRELADEERHEGLDGTGRFRRAGSGDSRSARRSGVTRRRSSGAEQSPRSTGSWSSDELDPASSGVMGRTRGSVKVVAKSSRTSKGHRVPTASSVREQEELSSLDAYKRSMRERDEAASAGRLSASSSFSRVGSSSPATTGRLSSLARDTGSFAPLDDADRGDAASSTYERRRRGPQRPQKRTSSSASGERASRGRYSKAAANVSLSLPERIVGAVTSALSEKRTRLIIIAVVCVVAALLLIASFLLSTAGRSDSGILNVEGGAGEQTITDNGTDKKTGSAVATVTTANGNPVSVTVDVPKGKTSLISIIYDDDKAYDGTAVGPWHREFQVTQSFSASFGTVEAVTVEANGSPVQISTQEDGSGSLELSVQASGLAGKK